MKRNNYYPAKQGDQIVWLANWVNKLPGYGTALGLTPAQIAAITADCLWLLYLLQSWQPAVRKWSLACTNAVAEAQTGTGTAVQALPVFTRPTCPPPCPPWSPARSTASSPSSSSSRTAAKPPTPS